MLQNFHAVSMIRSTELDIQFSLHVPRAGSGVVRIDPLCFLAGCRTRWL